MEDFEEHLRRRLGRAAEELDRTTLPGGPPQESDVVRRIRRHRVSRLVVVGSRLALVGALVVFGLQLRPDENAAQQRPVAPVTKPAPSSTPTLRTIASPPPTSSKRPPAPKPKQIPKPRAAAVPMICGSPYPSHARVPADEDSWTYDDILAEIANRAPAFAGWYRDGSHVIVRTTNTDPEVVSKVWRTMRDVYRERGEWYDELNGTPTPRLATYGWVPLKVWYDRLINVMSMPGATMSDIDEVRNRIAFGFEDPDRNRAEVEAMLDDNCVPRDAVIIEKREPIRQA